jgi:hypothetical protein
MKLRVWWIPQVPMKSFNIPVSSLQEARLLLDALALYDLFQLDNNVKPDFSNAGGLQAFDEKENEWSDWYDEETGEDFDEYSTHFGLDRVAEIREANANVHPTTV